MTVYLVYNGDSWLSSASLNLVAVCESKDKAEELLFEDLRDKYGIVSCNDVPEEDYDEDEIYLEECIKEYRDNGQILANGFSYTIETIDTNVII